MATMALTRMTAIGISGARRGSFAGKVSIIEVVPAILIEVSKPTTNFNQVTESFNFTKKGA